jgi:hypothetical protein
LFNRCNHSSVSTLSLILLHRLLFHKSINRLLTDIKEQTKQVKEQAAQFYAANYYKESIQLKDSSGNNVGVVRLDNAVSENTNTKLQPQL